MGVLTGAVHWWEESQLRALVLTSLLIQFFLFFFPFLRRFFLPGWFRFIMWLAYHGGDAVAIYALATLFNRHKVAEGDGGVGGGSSSNTLLEVVWAPVLLIHLGGHDGVTAYNIEDNELWSRHLLTAVSQVTVAVYVFCKSWPPGGDEYLLAAAVLLFIVGVVKCFLKALAFKRASIYSLVSSTDTAANQTNDDSMYNKLGKYVKDARDIVIQQLREEDPAVMTTSEARGLLWEGSMEFFKKGCCCCLLGLLPSSKDDEAAVRRMSGELSIVSEDYYHHRRERVEEARKLIQQEKEEHGEVSKLFVDLSSSYPRRISIFKKFWGLIIREKEETAYDSVRAGLASAFFLLYTKLKTAFTLATEKQEPPNYQIIIGSQVIQILYLIRTFLPWATIALFHHSHREAYNGIDVKVTYAILSCTAVLETYSAMILLMMLPAPDDGRVQWPETVDQYSAVGYFVRNKKHNIMMWVVSLLQCNDFLDEHWCMEPCFTSARITSLVIQYLKDGWDQKIQNAATYRGFNNHSSWGLNMNRPFDECVLLWHLATDFCFFSTRFPEHIYAFANPPTSRPEAVQCRPMVYLLFVNPEMLLPGSRRNLFKTAYGQLKDILKDWNWNPVCWSRCTPCGLGVKLIKEEAIVMEKLIEVMKNPNKRASEIAITVPQQNPKRSSQEGSSMGGSNREENFIDEAWDLAKKLLEKDEMERWKEIQDVWVQMLCFSASRCRGYLHAKALGKGGEFLSYVWLLLFYMGMETFSERLQRELFPSCQGNQYGTASSSEICEVADDVV